MSLSSRVSKTLTRGSLSRLSTRSLSSLPHSIDQMQTDIVSSPTFQFPSLVWDPKPEAEIDTNKDKIQSIADLVDQVPSAVSERKCKDIAPGSYNDPVMNLFRRLNLSTQDWAPYAFGDHETPYTRNLIATDHETYTLLLLCWNPQQESPIHDHPCDGCWLKVLEGSIRECRYDEKLTMIADDTFKEGQIAYITDNMGYHKIGNPSQSTQITTTLHLYAPPVHECRIWTEPDASSVVPHAKCSHYSEYGRRLSQ